MRTTLTLPADLHEFIRERAHRQRTTMSAVVVELLRIAQQGPRRPLAAVTASGRGVPTVDIGRPVTAEDVRSLEDD